MDTHHGLPHVIRRAHLDDVVKLYRDQKEEVPAEFPFCIKY